MSKKNETAATETAAKVEPLMQVLGIPHASQRYPTVGDWQDGDGLLTVTVSQCGDWRYESLVAVHEIVEALICRAQGIPEEKVTAFDVAFEAARKSGDDREPGSLPGAPYHDAHAVAEHLERVLAHAMQVDWFEYERALKAL